MNLRIGHLSLAEAPAGGFRATGAARAGRGDGPAAAVTADVIAASVPAEVSEQVAAAARRAEELWDANRELHFSKDPDSGRIIVQVRERDGTVIRTIPPSEALDVMSGLATV